MIGSKDVELISTVPKTTARRWSEKQWVRLLLLSNDAVAIGAGLLIAYVLRFQSHLWVFYEPEGSVTGFYRQLGLACIPLGLVIFAIFQLYDLQLLFGGLEEYARVFNACTTGIMMVMVSSFLIPDLVIARGWLLLSWFSVTVLAGVGRFVVRRLVYRMRTQGYFQRLMLIVGADEEGRAIAEQLASNPRSGVRIAGFVDDGLPVGEEIVAELRVLGTTNDLRRLVHQIGVQELVLSSTALSREKLLEVFRTFGNSGEVMVRLASGLFEILTTGVRVKNVGQVPLLSVNRVRLTGGDVVLKTVLDYAGAVLGLLFLSPLYVLIGVAIKLDSKGPVVYRRRVVGVGGKEFDAFKFRTMVTNAEEVLEQDEGLRKEFEKNYKLKEDPRVTGVGRILRKTSLDELPQLVNVLRGEMSLVGPRMITREEVARYGKWGMNLLTVKPGITGLWQVSGRSDVEYEGRVRLDMHYIRNYTVWLDLQIIFQTLPAVLRKDGAY